MALSVYLKRCDGSATIKYLKCEKIGMSIHRTPNFINFFSGVNITFDFGKQYWQVNFSGTCSDAADGTSVASKADLDYIAWYWNLSNVPVDVYWEQDGAPHFLRGAIIQCDIDRDAATEHWIFRMSVRATFAIDSTTA